MSETEKKLIYEKLIEKCSEKFEIGLILINTNKLEDRLRFKKERAFNYSVKLFLINYFKKCSTFKNSFDSINIIIDERNVASGSRYNFCEYLNTELNVDEPFCKANSDIDVFYSDSKRFLLLQFADFISNTFYRYFQKGSAESKVNIKLLRNLLCKKEIFCFPLNKK